MSGDSQNAAESRKAEQMMEEYEAKRQKRVSSVRSWMDYGIGTLVVFIGVFLFVRNWMVLDFNERFPPNNSDKIIGIVFALYGFWRIYRGYKKNYFK